jgi:hypothetical protein
MGRGEEAKAKGVKSYRLSVLLCDTTVPACMMLIARMHTHVAIIFIYKTKKSCRLELLSLFRNVPSLDE